MGRLTPKHPQPVKDAIYQAVQNRQKTTPIWQALTNGTLKGLEGPYPMPRSSVDYYVRQSRKRLAETQVTTLAAGDPSHAIDQLARQLISEAELGIDKLRRAKQRDPETAKRWADLLKVLSPLVRPGEPDKPAGKTRREPVPSDPLSARLMASQQTDNESASPRDTTSTDTPTPINEHTHRVGVAAQAVETDLSPA